VPLLLLFPVGAAAAPPTAQEIEFFEQKVRPILVEQCYGCHSQKSAQVKGGLLLDSRDGWKKGGKSGPVIRERNPDASRLIQAIRYTDKSLQMPPGNKKLSDTQIADLTTWVRMGAPDPREGNAALDPAVYWARARRHWAFRPVRKPALPAVKDSAWIRTPVDAFILVKLEEHGLRPSPPADKRVLIRRAYFDLIGLPPTPEDVDAFVHDNSPDAYERLIDRLLASPHYGERWGRHWLDVARYADSKGYLGNESDNRNVYAYTYRDYVIRAFNDDLPYDRFLLEQLAADQLGPSARPRSADLPASCAIEGGVHSDRATDSRALAALGFLTVGKRHLNNPIDIIDDRIDVISRGLLGLTVGCARCHDHKYDPVPTEDYYSLYGVFNSNVEPEEGPLLSGAGMSWDFQLELYSKRNALLHHRRSLEDAQLAKLREQSGIYLQTVYESGKLTEKLEQDQLALERKLDLQVMQRWRDRLRVWTTDRTDPVFTPWAAFAAIPENEFAAQAPAVTTRLLENGGINPVVARMVLGEPPTSLRQVHERYGRLLADVDRHWQECQAAQARRSDNSPPPSELPDPHEESIRQQALYGPDAPPNLPRNQLDRFYDRPVKHRLLQMRLDVNDVLAEHRGSPARAVVLEDAPKPQNTRVFIQGNPGRQGPEAPRRFLRLLAGDQRKPFSASGSGRLELAQAIASRDNPLTARVFVNRAWLHHFGSPLVRTPSDFGVRAEPPTHPELLDFLAWQFMEEAWSVKKLHRQLMLSATYQQIGDFNPQSTIPNPQLLDPDNRWYWRMNRRRLEYEALRDSLLAVSGQLDSRMGGRAVDLIARPHSRRRAVYGIVDRVHFPDQFRTFDVPNPEKTIASRPDTTVPQQALFFLNNELVIEQARRLAARTDGQATQEARIQSLYRRLFQRAATPEELRLAAAFLEAQAAKPADPLPAPEDHGWHYGSGAYDSTAHRVRQFGPLKHFADDAWQAGDPDQGKVRLSARGGWVGRGPQSAAIRRWVAPRDGFIRITGELSAQPAQAETIRGRIVSERQGDRGVWTADRRAVPTCIDRLEVKAGEAVDFVVDNPADAAFLWSPRVRVIDVPPGELGGLVTEWRAADDFRGPPRPLTPWEKYVQVLLMTNEFAFDE
jgi:hypothetical protein